MKYKEMSILKIMIIFIFSFLLLFPLITRSVDNNIQANETEIEYKILLNKPNIKLYRYYDKEEDVMCYITNNGGICCIPDTYHATLKEKKRESK